MFNRKYPPLYNTEKAQSITEPTNFAYSDDPEVDAYDTSHIDAYLDAQMTGDPVKDLAAVLGITDESLEAGRQRLKEKGIDLNSLDPQKEIEYLEEIVNREHTTRIDFSTFDDHPEISLLDQVKHVYPERYEDIKDPLYKSSVTEYLYNMFNRFYRMWERSHKKVRNAFKNQVNQNIRFQEQIDELDEMVNTRLDKIEEAIKEIQEKLKDQ